MSEVITANVLYLLPAGITDGIYSTRTTRGYSPRARVRWRPSDWVVASLITVRLLVQQ
jgi:hypothetical protein